MYEQEERRLRRWTRLGSITRTRPLLRASYYWWRAFDAALWIWWRGGGGYDGIAHLVPAYLRLEDAWGRGYLAVQTRLWDWVWRNIGE